MKPRKVYPKFPKNKSKDKLKVYSGAPINKGFYERNLNTAKPLYMNKYANIAKKYYRKKEDREFKQLLNTYYNDFNKFKKSHKILSKPLRDQTDTFDFNLYELKKKNLSVLFFNYDLKYNEDIDYSFTDGLINSMYNGKNDTLIKTTQIRNDYEMRLNGERKKNNINYNNYINNDEDRNKNENIKNNNIGQNNVGLIVEPTNVKPNSDIRQKNGQIITEETDENIFYLEDGDQIIDDNYLDFKTNLYYNKNFPLFKEIINSNFNEDYQIPIYKTPESNNKDIIDTRNNTSFNKYKDMKINNDYPIFDQVTNPHYETDYKPPPCFPRLPEDEEEDENDNYGNEDFGFNEDNNNQINDENDDGLILLSNKITNNDFPKSKHLINNDYKGEYAPLTDKIPSHTEKDMKNGEEKLQKNKRIYEENKNLNVENDINRYKDGELKMLDNIIKDNKYPLFDQIIDPYYQTDYIPPKIFPKPPNIEEEEEDQNYGYGDFELNPENQIKGNDNDNDLVLISNAVLNNEYPMYENLIRNDFKGNYAPPIYKIPDFMQEDEKVDINQRNAQNFNEMRGNYINYNNYEGNEYPTVNNIIQNDNIGKKEEKRVEEEDEYNDFEN